MIMKQYRANADSVASRIVDDEAVLVHTETSEYFSLNLAGTFLWQLMVEQPLHEDELVTAISARYQLDETEARAQLLAFLTKLEQAGLLVDHSDGQALGGAKIDALADPVTHTYEPPDLVKFGDLETLILSGE
jgi:hypothetical protein